MKELAKRSAADARLRGKAGGTAGFTIVEVLAALTMFAIVSAGLVASSIGAVRYNRISSAYSAATELAQDKIEELRALDPNTNPAALASGTHGDPKNPMNALGVQAGTLFLGSPVIGVFRRNWTVTLNSPVAGMSKVVVSVDWSDGQTRKVELWTYVCRKNACT